VYKLFIDRGRSAKGVKEANEAKEVTGEKRVYKLFIDKGRDMLANKDNYDHRRIHLLSAREGRHIYSQARSAG
jgi:hypothetical protein